MREILDASDYPISEIPPRIDYPMPPYPVQKPETKS